jgi:hypothetical protein
VRINLAGEPVPRALVDSLYATGAREVYNLYGPSETTTYSTSAPLAPGVSGLPEIGRPIANTRAYVLDGNLKPLPIGVPGELYLGGAGVARGYLGRPALTAERFLPDPFGTLGGTAPGGRLYRTGDRARWRADGNLEFLGRLDQQLKLRGYRIEPGEIEAALSQHPNVRTAVVLAREDSPDDVRLVAYVVPEKAPPTSDELRGFLQARLPGYMVPDAIVFLAALPRTANGKLDRLALPAPHAPEGVREDYAAPQSPVEELVAGIWVDVLRLARVGIRDNFFAIGGHSLLATQVVSRIRTVMGVELPLRALFENPTVSALATRISNELLETSAAREPDLVPLPREAYRVNEISKG